MQVAIGCFADSSVVHIGSGSELVLVLVPVMSLRRRRK
jgi:hypothetical protein